MTQSKCNPCFTHDHNSKFKQIKITNDKQHKSICPVEADDGVVWTGGEGASVAGDWVARIGVVTGRSRRICDVVVVILIKVEVEGSSRELEDCIVIDLTDVEDVVTGSGVVVVEDVVDVVRVLEGVGGRGGGGGVVLVSGSLTGSGVLDVVGSALVVGSGSGAGGGGGGGGLGDGVGE